MSDGETKDSVDTIKLYICLMGGLSVVTLIWLIYNYLSLNTYGRMIAEGEADLETIVELASALPPQQEGGTEKVVENELVFFTRTVRDIPETPEMDDVEEETIRVKDSVFKEKRYIVRFQKRGISREDLIRYIHVIRSKKPFLRAKRLEWRRPEDAAGDEDRWLIEIEFAFRKGA